MRNFWVPIFLWGSVANASVNSETVRMALSLPVPHRFQSLEEQGLASVDILKSVALEAREPLSSRWRAILALGKVYPGPSAGFLTGLLNRNEWYYRNAAVLSLAYGDRARALAAIRKTLSDPALVVRTAAVQVALQIRAKELEEVLWEKLSSRENFNKGQSLWVRKYIISALSELATESNRIRFQPFLQDPDLEIQKIAQMALKPAKTMNGHKVVQIGLE